MTHSTSDGATGGKLAVLVVDGSITIRAMPARIIEGAGDMEVVTVRSAREAEAELARRRFDAMTPDVEMPHMNGLDYLSVVIERHALPVIMLSASTGRGAAIAARALRTGAVGCFGKAVKRAAVLLRMVRKAAATTLAT